MTERGKLVGRAQPCRSTPMILVIPKLLTAVLATALWDVLAHVAFQA